MSNAFHYFLDNIFIRFGSKLYRQIVGIPMGINCAPLVADLFLFCYERDFMFPIYILSKIRKFTVSYSCLHPLSNERKSMFKSGDSRAV